MKMTTKLLCTILVLFIGTNLSAQSWTNDIYFNDIGYPFVGAATIDNQGTNDIYVLELTDKTHIRRITETGQTVWQKQISSERFMSEFLTDFYLSGLAKTPNGIYTIESYYGTTPRTFARIVGVDESQQNLPVVQFGQVSGDVVFNDIVYHQGHLYVVGTLLNYGNNTAPFTYYFGVNTNGQTVNITTTAQSFIAKYELASNKLVWVEPINQSATSTMTTSSAEAYNLDITDDGDIYISGIVRSGAVFINQNNPANPINTTIPSGESRPFLAKFKENATGIGAYIDQNNFPLVIPGSIGHTNDLSFDVEVDNIKQVVYFSSKGRIFAYNFNGQPAWINPFAKTNFHAYDLESATCGAIYATGNVEDVFYGYDYLTIAINDLGQENINLIHSVVTSNTIHNHSTGVELMITKEGHKAIVGNFSHDTPASNFNLEYNLATSGGTRGYFVANAFDDGTPAIDVEVDAHMEDASGVVKSVFGCTEDFFLDGRGSSGEVNYFIDIWERPGGSSQAFSYTGSLGWTNNSTVPKINLKQLCMSKGILFHVGREYQVKLAIQNPPCVNWLPMTLNFTIMGPLIDNSFILEDANNVEKYVFNCGEEVFLDASNTQGATGYFIHIFQRPINSGAAFTDFHKPGWFTPVAVMPDHLNLNSLLSAGLNFSAGMEYQIKFVIHRPPCEQWLPRTLTFQVQNGGSLNPDFSYTYTGNQSTYDLTLTATSNLIAASHLWEVTNISTGNIIHSHGWGTGSGFENHTISGLLFGEHYRIDHYIENKTCGVLAIGNSKTIQITQRPSGQNSDPANVETYSNRNELSVFPNPTTSEINIGNVDKIVKVNIYSMEGRLVLEATTDAINVSHLIQGIYILEVVTANGVQQAQFVKK